MKSKAPLALIELVIMLLIFVLAAALCLQAFLWAQQQSETIILRDEAAIAVQNAAELIKSSKGDEKVIASITASDNDVFKLNIECLDVNARGLGSALVTAESETGENIFSLQIFWQEPLEGGEARE